METTELAYPDASAKLEQIDQHLESYSMHMRNASNTLQEVASTGASGNFMRRFGAMWNERSDEMYAAYTGLKQNAEVCEQNYMRINNIAD